MSMLVAVAHLIVDNTPDPNAAGAVRATWATYDVTLSALIVAVVAAIAAFGALAVAMYDARNNAQQLRMLTEERLRKPKLGLLWETGNAFQTIDADAKQIFEGYCALSLPVRILNNGDLAAHDVTIILHIPMTAKTKSQMPRPVQLRLGLPDVYSVKDLHDLGVFAHDRRSPDPDGRRHDYWDLRSVKSGAFIDFAALNVLLPRGRSVFEWIAYCEEGVAENGTLEVEIGFPAAY